MASNADEDAHPFAEFLKAFTFLNFIHLHRKNTSGRYILHDLWHDFTVYVTRLQNFGFINEYSALGDDYARLRTNCAREYGRYEGNESG